MRKIAVLAAAAVVAVSGLAVSGAASASTVTLNETLDISQPQNGGTSFGGWRDFTADGGAFSPSYSFDLSAGDTVDMSVQFLAGQSLTLVNPTTLWLFNFITAGDQSNVDATGSLELLGSDGSVLYASNTVTDAEGSVHFGQFFSNSDFTDLPGTVTFSGLRYVGTLNAYEDPDVTVRTYGDPDFAFTADSATISGVVPEPAAWALMILGFGGAGAALRRRARQALA
jgi:PEP-CTERM motif